MRLIGLAVVLAILAGMAPGRASAAPSRGGSYTSENFGFTVTWDESIWEGGKAKQSDGVELSSELSYGLIQPVDYDGDPADCVADSVTSISGGADVFDFGKAPRRMTRPETAADAEGELFTYVNANDSEIAMYIECRALGVDGVLLQAVLITMVDNYDDAVETWSDLLSDIEVEGAKDSRGRGDDSGTKSNGSKKNNDKSSRVKAGIDGNIYYAPDYGFSSTWDEDFWSVRELEADEEMGTGIEVQTEYTIGWVTVGDELTGDFETCADDFADGISQYPMFTKFRKASRKLALPETDRDAVGSLYTFTQEVESGDTYKMVGYFECRMLADEDLGVATVFLATTQDTYEDELPAWEDLLAGIEIDGPAQDKGDKSADKDSKSSNKGSKSSTKKGDDPVENSDAPAEASFVGPNFGFTVALDESVWTFTDLSDENNDFLSLESEVAIGNVIGFGSAYDASACLELLIGLKTSDGVTTFDLAPESMKRPKTARGATGELFIYTFQGENGPVEVVSYFECRPLAGGAASLGIVLTTVPAVYDSALPEFNKLLKGIGTAQEA